MSPGPMTTLGRLASWSGLLPASYRSSLAAPCTPARRRPNLSWCRRRNDPRAYGLRSRANLRSRSRSAVVGYTVSVSAPSLTAFLNQQTYDYERGHGIDPPCAEHELSHQADHDGE